MSVAHGLAADHAGKGERARDAVTVSDASWHDARRNRLLPLKLRVPQGARGTPVILYSHGLGGSRESGEAWADHWAAFGYLVLSIQHPGSDSAANAAAANSLEQYLVRIQDVHFILDELARRKTAGDPLLARADVMRIGMSGHSFGAQTTLAVSGMRLGDTLENGVKPFDARIRAALAFSPTAAGAESAESNYPQRFGAIRMPFMTVTGTEDGDSTSRGYAWENRQIPYQHMPAAGKYLLVLKGADHWVYGGPPGMPRGARARDAAIIRWTQLATTAFWDAHLRNDVSARERLDTFADVLGTAGTFSLK